MAVDLTSNDPPAHTGTAPGIAPSPYDKTPEELKRMKAEEQKRLDAAAKQRALFNKYGPGAAPAVDRGAWSTTSRGTELQGAVDNGIRRSFSDANSTDALQRFNVDEAAARRQQQLRNAERFDAPQYQAGPGVTPGTALLDQGRTNAALGSAAGYLQGQDATRGLQQGQTGYLGQLQRGEGPSVGALTAQQGALRGANLMQDAGVQSARAMMQSQQGATGSYMDAANRQNQATGLAAYQSGNVLQDNADAAVRAQASLAARARGGNIGASLLNAQNNAAAGSQRLAIDQGRFMEGANRIAAENAANSMLAAQRGDVQARLQAAGAMERGQLAGGQVGADMMLEGAKIRSDEQLRATGMMTDALGNIRGQDLGAAGAATNLAGVNLNADAGLGDMSRFNVEQGFRGQMFNADDAYRAGALNTGNVLATNTLNSGLSRDYDFKRADIGTHADDVYREDVQRRDLANQGAELQARGLYGQEGLTYTGMGIGQEEADRAANIGYETTAADQYSHGLDRMANYETGQATNAANAAASRRAANSQTTAALIGGGAVLTGTILNSIFSGSGPDDDPTVPPTTGPTTTSGGGYPNYGQASDIRLKKNIRPAGSAADVIANFRRAKNYEYDYKSPADGVGRKTGPMAHELPQGVQVRRPDGKLAIDPARLALVSASAIGEQQRRLDALERRR